MARTGKSIGLSELRVGIFTFVGLAILVFFILNASGNFNPFERKFHLKARFGTADGLREGAEVQLAGMPVGKVEEVKLLPPGEDSGAKVEARLTLSPRVDGQAISDRIRTDSTAQLVAQNILGNDKVIDITPGTSAGIPVAENHVLESVTPATINQLTVSGNDLVQQLNKLALPVTDIASKINQGEGTAGKLINDEALYNNLNATINEAQGTVNELKSTISKV
ncbi:MAG: MCE family protein, partial [Pyrinomonadaceae bacterium]|nr:MCE family protein [Pyrinomonadaceae bacterium]